MLSPQTQNWNYFADNESDSVKMMEEVEKLCDRLELARYIQEDYSRDQTLFSSYNKSHMLRYKMVDVTSYVDSVCRHSNRN